jgi:DNA mismatch repair ATPase MutS
VDTLSYAETTELLSLLAPEEILLHGSACQGSSKSLLCRKIEKWRDHFPGNRPVIKPVSRAYFDQDRGAEFLRRVSISQIDSEIIARYTVLGAAFALLKYIESTASMTFPRRSVKLNFIDNSVGDFLIIDRRTSTCLEILNNARTGDQHNCLFGKIDRTKVGKLCPYSSFILSQICFAQLYQLTTH